MAGGQLAKRIEQAPKQLVGDRAGDQIAAPRSNQVARKLTMAAPFAMRPAADVGVGVVPVGTLPADDDERFVGAHQMILECRKYAPAADRHSQK